MLWRNKADLHDQLIALAIILSVVAGCVLVTFVMIKFDLPTSWLDRGIGPRSFLNLPGLLIFGPLVVTLVTLQLWGALRRRRRGPETQHGADESVAEKDPVPQPTPDEPELGSYRVLFFSGKQTLDHVARGVWAASMVAVVVAVIVGYHGLMLSCGLLGQALAVAVLLRRFSLVISYGIAFIVTCITATIEVTVARGLARFF